MVPMLSCRALEVAAWERTEMNHRLKSRIARMERTLPRLPAPVVPSQCPALLLASRLAGWGIERGPNESLAETTARAMGIGVRDLAASWLGKRFTGLTTARLFQIATSLSLGQEVARAQSGSIK